MTDKGAFERIDCFPREKRGTIIARDVDGVNT